jgi:hypothetical protein
MSPRSTIAHLLAAAVLLAGCAGPSDVPTALHAEGAARAKSSSAPSSVNVTTTIYDTDGAGAALLTRSDGAGSATYTSTSRATSIIIGDNSWQIYLGSQSARTVYLVLQSQGIPIPDGYYSSNVEVYSQCFDASGAPASLLVMAAGTSNHNCSFGVDFSSGSTKYKLVMSPKFPGTGHAVVTCVAGTAASCTSWTIAPDASLPDAGVANLYHFAKNPSLVLDGVYRNSYLVMASR